jgi:hypothetical protein
VAETVISGTERRHSSLSELVETQYWAMVDHEGRLLVIPGSAPNMNYLNVPDEHNAYAATMKEIARRLQPLLD